MAVARVWDGAAWQPGNISPEPPPDGWPDAFMSYPSSDPIVLSDVHGTAENPHVIEYYSFEDVYRPAKPISLENCSYITIRRIDSRKCTMGIVYAVNCDNIILEYCRAENIAYEFKDQFLLPPEECPGGETCFGNENDCNFYQFDKCTNVTTRHLKGRYGNTEDVFSFYMSHDSTAEDIQWQGGIATDQPTSDGSESVPWTSSSGTAHILGDEGGTGLTVKDSTFLDAGQVPLQIAGGENCVYENNVVYGTGNTDQPWNTGATTWCGTPPMTGHRYVGNRVQYFKSDGSSNPVWFDGDCEAPEDTDNVWGDDTLIRDDYIVDL